MGDNEEVSLRMQVKKREEDFLAESPPTMWQQPIGLAGPSWTQEGSFHAMCVELIGGRIANHWIGALHDWMAEMGAENCPRSTKKSDAKSCGHIPLGHASIDEWKQILASVRAEVSGPISVLI